MAIQIRQITPYTGDVPVPGQAPAVFSQNSQDQLGFMNSLADELVNTISDMNSSANEMEVNAQKAEDAATASEAAASTAGYQGLWPDTGGSAEKGDTYQTQVGGTPTGEYYTALKDTSVDPVGDNVNWKINVSEVGVNAGDSQLSGGVIWPVNSKKSLSLGTQSTIVGAGACRLRVNTGSEVQLLYLWEPSGDFASTEHTVTNIVANNFAGYDVTTDQGVFEFLQSEVLLWRGCHPAKNAIMSQRPDIRGWGAIPNDMTVNNSPNIQAACDYLSDQDTTTLTPKTTSAELWVPPLGFFRCTEQIHKKSGVHLMGASKSQPTEQFIITGAKASTLYADLDNPNQSFIVVSGYSTDSGFAPVGQLIDPYKTLITSTTFDSGKITRSYGDVIEGINFFTDKFVLCPVSIGAAPGGRYDYFSRGFLTQHYSSSSWNTKINVVGASYHYGTWDYNSNGSKKSGYVEKIPGGPAITLSNVPAGYQDDPSNDPAYALLSCGSVNIFVAAGSLNNLITEGFEKARQIWSCRSFVDNDASYLEGILSLGWQVTASSVQINGTFNNTTAYLCLANSDSSVRFNSIDQFVGKICPPEQASWSTSSKITVQARSPSSIDADDKYFPHVQFDFQEKEFYIWLDPNASGGNNDNYGLNASNPVQSLDVAIERCKEYGISTIKVLDGSQLKLFDNVLVDRKIVIEPQSTTATLRAAPESGNSNALYYIGLENGGDVEIRNMTIQTAGTPTGLSSRALFRCLGDSSVSLIDCVTSSSDATALFNSATGFGSFLKFAVSRGSLSSMNLGFNDFSAAGSVQVINSRSSVTESNTLAWPSNFNILS